MKPKQVIKLLEAAGYAFKRISKSSHHQYKRDGRNNIVTIPIHGNKDIKKGTLSSIFRQAGLDKYGQQAHLAFNASAHKPETTGVPLKAKMHFCS